MLHPSPGDALTGWCETFDGDSCRHHSHCAKVNDPDDRPEGELVAAVDAALGGHRYVSTHDVVAAVDERARDRGEVVDRR